MQIAALFFLLLATAGFSSPLSLADPTSDLAAQSCPLSSQGETQQDCPWAALARAWPVDLRKQAPELERQIREDAKLSTFKKLWGESTNFDELAHAMIVRPEILRSLARTMKVPCAEASNEAVCLAGLEHTYGYLFSTLKTSFGFKRARWVSGQLERGFGLEPGLLGPNAPQAGGGTLFSNVTYFFGRMAFRDNSQRLVDLEAHSKSVAPAIRNFKYDALKPVRLEEIIPSERVLIHTDLVPFTTDPGHELLVYSVVRNGSALLITGFPITREFAESLVNPDQLGDDRPIVTRYNAYVEGISGKKFTGTRRVVQVQYVDWRKQHGHARR